LLAAVLITVRHWRRDRRFTKRHFRGSAWYLNRRYVKDFYQVDKYRAAPSQDIEEMSSTSRTSRARIGIFRRLNLDGQHKDTNEVHRRYKKKSKMSAVIGMLMDDLDKLDDIVYVDLHKREVGANQALGKLVGAQDGKLPDSTRLVDIGSWVSIYGLFRVAETTESDVVLQAPYGNPAKSAHAPNVRIRCTRKWLRDATVLEDPFRAHCLGRVERWESGSGAGYLVVYPVAVFR